MSLKYGTLEEKTHEEHGRYLSGQVTTEGYRGGFYAVPNLRKEKDSQPDFIIKEPARQGGRELGAIWEKSKRETGEVFYTLTFDGPTFSMPCNLAAFKDDEGDHYNVIFKRKRGGGAATSQATGGKATDAVAGDEIPFG